MANRKNEAIKRRRGVSVSPATQPMMTTAHSEATPVSNLLVTAAAEVGRREKLNPLHQKAMHPVTTDAGVTQAPTSSGALVGGIQRRSAIG